MMMCRGDVVGLNTKPITISSHMREREREREREMNI